MFGGGPWGQVVVSMSPSGWHGVKRGLEGSRGLVWELLE